MDQNIKESFIENIKKALATGQYNGITLGGSFQEFLQKKIFPFEPVVSQDSMFTTYDYNGLRVEINNGRIINIVIKNTLPIYTQDITENFGEGGSSSSDDKSFLFYMGESCIATFIFPNFLSPVSEIMISGTM